MVDKTRIILIILGITLFIYLIWCFIGGTFNIMNIGGDSAIIMRLGMVMIYLVSLWSAWIILSESKYIYKETIKQKETRLSKYVGELEEELKLYNKAKLLEIEVNKLRIKKG